MHMLCMYCIRYTYMNYIYCIGYSNCIFITASAVRKKNKYRGRRGSGKDEHWRKSSPLQSPEKSPKVKWHLYSNRKVLFRVFAPKKKMKGFWICTCTRVINKLRPVPKPQSKLSVVFGCITARYTPYGLLNPDRMFHSRFFHTCFFAPAVLPYWGGLSPGGFDPYWYFRLHEVKQ